MALLDNRSDAERVLITFRDVTAAATAANSKVIDVSLYTSYTVILSEFLEGGASIYDFQVRIKTTNDLNVATTNVPNDDLIGGDQPDFNTTVLDSTAPIGFASITRGVLKQDSFVEIDILNATVNVGTVTLIAVIEGERKVAPTEREGTDISIT